MTYGDAVSTMKSLGHQVFTVQAKAKKHDEDSEFIETVKAAAINNNCEIIFSFNYFPDLSRAAGDLGIRYICWCYDSPMLTLESVTVANDWNSIYLFDRGLCEKYNAEGITNIYHLPLAVNVERLDGQLGQMKEYRHELSFLGSLYDDEYNFYDKIGYLPDYIKGYLDATMNAQLPIHGYDMISELMNDNIFEELFKYVKINLGPNYRDCKKEIFTNMLKKRVTVVERRSILSVLSELYMLDLCSPSKPENINARYMGYASYDKQMPEVFRTSKINYNITLRTIKTGIPLRVLDILGAKGFCITNYQEEIAEHFVNDESIVWYESFEDLFEKTAYYLQNDDARQRIIENGYEIVKKKFNYKMAFEKIL